MLPDVAAEEEPASVVAATVRSASAEYPCATCDGCREETPDQQGSRESDHQRGAGALLIHAAINRAPATAPHH
ncbi:hypothetical protein GCM10018793_25930 [Streptomyces sulfonofaciens]|uniref:Uncharacterized protein n=1 Tax=Streptomyces sulfonofaciens TaxID=68272 RepID=A0A919KYR5_9ACTN|nr:hypothetical protein GCM10018793_25930 [Streptomyces sulfonofaciens]